MLALFVAYVLGGGVIQQEQDILSPAEPAPLGWDKVVVPLAEGQPMTELDRLSVSPSGAGASDALYDSQSDNPLVPVSVTLRALDKITATYRDLEVNIGEQADFGALKIVPRTCDKRPPEETPETTVFLEVFSTEQDVQGARTREARRDDRLPQIGDELPDADEQEIIDVDGPLDALVQNVDGALFRGWMFASSPSLNALEHPVYDVWVIDCTMVAPEI